MSSKSDGYQRSPFSGEDLAKLRSVVRRNASATLSDVDVEDITGEILLSACVTAARADSTAPLRVLAFRYARLPYYYTAARRAAAAVLPQDPRTYAWDARAVATATLSVDFRRVLYTLEPGSSTILWLYEVEGLTLDETAMRLGISKATAFRRVQQAHAAFRAAWSA